MALLDSDHLSVLRYRTSAPAARLADRLSRATEPPVGTTVANVEEAMRGWLAAIAKEKEVRRQVAPYRELAELFAFFAAYPIALFTDAAADHFARLRADKVRIGTMDLKTASIARSNNALLLTANTQDFEQVLGLRFENWLDG